MTKLVLNADDLKKAHKRLSAIDHPKRLETIKMLLEKPKMNVTQIYTRLGIEQAASSHHLKLLRNSGILDAKREGKEIYYSLNQGNFNHLLECIELCNEFKA